ncbi:hypothetical protein SDC9_190796 [bioreactor metagenome]|uniref:Uncharacterized protein n=1 Tax=bioreactor metagenome TaxID=1076179 RepID=A0A645HW72_9ZZZZ
MDDKRHIFHGFMIIRIGKMQISDFNFMMTHYLITPVTINPNSIGKSKSLMMIKNKLHPAKKAKSLSLILELLPVMYSPVKPLKIIA